MSLAANDNYDSRRDSLPTFDGTAADWDYWAWSVTGDLICMEPVGSYPKFIEHPINEILDEIHQKHHDRAVAAEDAAAAAAAQAAIDAAIAGNPAPPAHVPAVIDVDNNAEFKAEVKQAQRQRHKLCRMIMRACKKDAIRALQGVDQSDVYAVWQKLLTEYRGIGQASVDQTYATIWRMQADPSKPISALISEMNKLFDRVAYYGEPVSDLQKGAALKLALPKKFGVLKTALAPWKNMSYKEICEQLVSHDTTNKTGIHRVTAAVPVTPATFIPSSSYVSSATDFRCYNCGKALGKRMHQALREKRPRRSLGK